ncbi:hypothetical protein ACFR99_15490 [Haloarchaeobius amylolyticus]|uniref:Uncharacterized protein n=1 Tax=Haloarchaeobius amylolyticus TaxID=1198296 RepID=A0ABD6BK33_9EURY
MTDLHRRNALGLLAGGMAFLAGCSESSDGNGNGTDPATDGSTDSAGGELPPYASMLPTTEQPEYFYGAIDVETMYTLVNDEGAEAGKEPTDPLVGNPVVVALLCWFGLGQLGTSAGFDAYNDNNETENGEEQFVYADGVYALVGSYDRDGVATDLEAAGYSIETEADGYSVYADSSSDEVVGVTDDVYAYSYPNGGDSSFDPVTAVERTVATAAGEQAPKHEADDDFEQLLRAGDNSGIACCLYTDDDAFDSSTLSDDQASDTDSLQFEFGAFDGSYGVHQGLSVAGDAATARATVSYSSDDLVDEDGLESSLGTEATTKSVDRAETTVTIDAEYGEEFARE